MWDILSEGAIGLVLLMKNDRPKPLIDLTFFLRAFEPLITATRLAVGVTSMDRSSEPTLNDHRAVLSQAGLSVPLFEVDARRRQDVSMLVKALLLSEDPLLQSWVPIAGA